MFRNQIKELLIITLYGGVPAIAGGVVFVDLN